VRLTQLPVENGCYNCCLCVHGRTPLHCAASSNNIEAIQLLIEHGAGVLAFTWDTEHETPLDKCCVDSPRYEQCYQFIAGILQCPQLLCCIFTRET